MLTDVGSGMGAGADGAPAPGDGEADAAEGAAAGMVARDVSVAGTAMTVSSAIPMTRLSASTTAPTGEAASTSAGIHRRRRIDLTLGSMRLLVGWEFEWR